MNREHITWVAVVAALLIAGLLIGQQFLGPPEEARVDSFRQWFWESRSLDLAAQVGLIFVGALGIAALLPKGKDDDE